MTTPAEQVQRILDRENARQERLTAFIASVDAEELPLAAVAPTEVTPRALLAEGDSWFDYPGTDVLNALEGLGYDIYSSAHRGDTIESMAYGEKQLDGLSRKMAKMARKEIKPHAILLSGGGNDIAGPEFRLFLDHARSNTAGLNAEILRGILERLRGAFEFLITKIGLLHEAHFDEPPRKFILHGYARPVPDGRGFWGGWGPLPGPWLEPSFHERGFLDLPQNTQIMSDLIDRFNLMLQDLVGSSGDPLEFVDLRAALSNDLTDRVYREDWDNELHPEEEAFEEIARLIHGAI